GDDRAGGEAEPQRLLAGRPHVVRDRVGHGRVEESLPPVEAGRPAERERQLAVRPLKREDRHQDHRDVEEEEEDDEVRGQTDVRPARALLALAFDDDVLRPLRAPRRTDERVGQSSSRRFANLVMTQTPAIRAITSTTAEAAPCGYWTAPIFE